MSKPKTRKPAGLPQAASESETPPWEGALLDEVIVVTRLEVEARENYNPELEDEPVEVRRWLRTDETETRGRTWFFDFQVASPNKGGPPYRFLVHLYATVNDGDPQADPIDVATAVMAHLSPRLLSVATEQLFAATVRGPWGPMTLPPQSPTAGRVRRLKAGAVATAREIADLLVQGPMTKVELAGKFGADLDEALRVALIQGLVEEEGSLVRLRKVV